MIIEKCVYDINGTIVTTVAQWDNGVAVYLSDPGILKSYPCHFSSAVTKESIVVNSSYSNGALKIIVPDILLQYPYAVTGYIYVQIDGGNRSIYRFRINVAKKAKPSDYVYDPSTGGGTSSGNIDIDWSVTDNGNGDVVVDWGSQPSTQPSYDNVDTKKYPISNPTGSVLIAEYKLNNIANSIKNVDGITTTMDASQMETRIGNLMKIPTEKLVITENNKDNIDVMQYAYVKVAVPEPSGNKTITANGTDIDVKNYATVTVNVPTDGTNLANGDEEEY